MEVKDMSDHSLEKTIAVTTDSTMIDHFSHSNSSFFSSRPEMLKCPYCRQIVRSITEIEPSGKTHCIAFLLFFLCMPCSFLPYCLYSCHNHHHYCPKCGGYMGTHYF